MAMKQSLEEVRMKGRRIKTTPAEESPKVIPLPKSFKKAKKTVKRKTTKPPAMKKKPRIKKKK